MNTRTTFALAVAGALTLSGCDALGMKKEPAEPKGQVAAVVNGEEITQREVQLELSEAGVPSSKAAEQQALQSIIARRVVAAAAEEQELDKSPEYVILRERALDNVLASLVEKKATALVQTPTADEVQRYVAENPDQFGERKIWVIDSIRFTSASRDVLEGLVPLTTMAQVEAYLASRKIAFTRGTVDVDALTLDPGVVRQIGNLPPNELFVIPGGGGLSANHIREAKVVPFTGPQANEAALAILKRTRIQQARGQAFQQLMVKAKPTIKYNPAYQPPAPAGAPAGKAAPTPGTPPAVAPQKAVPGNEKI